MTETCYLYACPRRRLTPACQFRRMNAICRDAVYGPDWFYEWVQGVKLKKITGKKFEVVPQKKFVGKGD
jgi:hypothetical protein